ncbi:MAG: phosphoglycerate mutase family protein [Actinomycetota bacterium]|nr:phosphoglycerate mutase family protein [Actinomycetota bacterium]
MSILVVRHASAGTRLTEDGDDAERPLDRNGTLQAASIADAFTDRSVSTVLSSRAVRCQQTVSPLAQRAGLTVVVSAALFEGASLQAVRLVNGMAEADDGNETTVLCSHGDVVSEIVRSLALAGMRTRGDRGCAKGSVWELICSNGEVVEGHYHRAPSL